MQFSQFISIMTREKKTLKITTLDNNIELSISLEVN